MVERSRQSGVLLFRADADALHHPRARRAWEQRALTEFADHVEWSDGRRTTAMRLPNQPEGATNYPTMSAVLIGEFQSDPLSKRVSFYRLRFLDDTGAVIAWFATQANTDNAVFERAFHDGAVFDALAKRGVAVQREVFQSERAFYDAHPDPRITGRTLVFARHPLRFAAALAAVLVLVAAIIAIVQTYG